ncbi:MAG: DMT family transporter [bacterium]
MSIGWVIFSIAMASLEPIIVKFFYNQHQLNPFEIIIFKNLFAGIVIIPLIYLLGFKIRVLAITDILNISRVSFLLLFTTSAMIISLKYIPAFVMLTIFSSNPAFVTMINQLKGKNTVDSVFWIGFLIAFIGICLLLEIYNINLHFSLNFFLGVVICFMGVLSSGLYRTTLDELTHRYTPIVVSCYIFLINLIFICIFLGGYYLSSIMSLIESPDIIGGYEVWVGIYGGIAGALANIAFLYALNLLGSTKVSILNMLQQPTIILLSVILLNEKINAYQIIGILLVILGVNIAIRRIKLLK